MRNENHAHTWRITSVSESNLNIKTNLVID